MVNILDMVKVIGIKSIFIILLSNVIEAQIDFGQFKGEKVNASLSTYINDTFIYDYRINASKKDSIVVNVIFGSSPESVLTKVNSSVFSKVEEVKDRNYISLLSKLNFVYLGSSYCLIKYRTVVDSLESKSRIFELIKKNNIWQEFDDKELFETKKEVLRLLPTKIFWQFYAREDNPEYLEINKLKPLVKDANGVLNIEKLAQVIKENKASLSKYLDE